MIDDARRSRFLLLVNVFLLVLEALLEPSPYLAGRRPAPAAAGRQYGLPMALVRLLR